MSKGIRLPFAPQLLTQIDEAPVGKSGYFTQLKYDGVRFVLTPDRQILSRKCIVLPAAHEDWFKGLPDGQYWEGEIYSTTAPCAEVSGFLQRRLPQQMPEHFRIVVFDTFREKTPYEERFKLIPEQFRPVTADGIVDLDIPDYCDGLVFRNKKLNYFGGRSPWDFKLKRWMEWDCEIVSAYHRETNENPQETDALGYAKRSHSNHGKFPTEFVGGFLVRVPHSRTNETFIVGSGIPKDWKLSSSWAGKTAVVRFNGFYGDDLPRFPRLVEVRD